MPGESLPDVHGRKRGRNGEADDQREPKVQGALILQSLMRLDEPHCSIVVDRFALSKIINIHKLNPC